MPAPFRKGTRFVRYKCHALRERDFREYANRAWHEAFEPGTRVLSLRGLQKTALSAEPHGLVQISTPRSTRKSSCV